MKPLQELQREAAQKRLEMDAAFRDLRGRLTVRGLADETAALITPYQSRVMPIYESVKRNPLVAAALLAGAGWLISQGRDRQPPKKRNAET